MTQIAPKPGIMDIALYVSGESRLAGHEDVLKLSSNENPLGCSPAAQEAFRAASGDLHRYPATDHAPLRRAIAEVHGLDPDRIICGVGSDEVLQFVTHAFAGHGDQIITTEHGFSMYPILARMVGATPVTVPENDRRIDVDAILAAVTERTRIVFVANPANPTGTMLSADELDRLASGLPPHVVFVHDGAYTEFAGGFDGGASLVDRFPNVVMTRTFSKIHGLGGLRIGWGYAAREIIDVLNRLRQPFNLSQPQMAAAEAAIRDTAFTAHCADLNDRMRDRMRQSLVQMGIACDESFANFVLARFADPAEAEAADAALRDAGILVRRVGGYGLPDALRITVGDEDGVTRVLDVLGSFIQGRRT
ncbi:histidinol-phosphate transaminase [Paracoccus sp. 1_MG-2023]|uniref:histidinol-phosphate transaminase n=1 Tax=unclassified Paracoccus (in: a-proteobacteria) TaxID=2688777 RepID=UPI001C086545|nr:MULTISPECIES: histidinol-phosphate transaminase [unclassified Paracoccus (in: a-proteobacteria)]MBU2959063.1 histidinol-phosphate transaminase [Paracoccus sp. C2R09]MDO6669036.1 histidinol-phosphate transaminase [Paracoccus sp. 1_MG-2023]